MSERMKIIKNELKKSFSVFIKEGVLVLIIISVIYKTKPNINDEIWKLIGMIICASVLWGFITSIIRIIASLAALKSAKNEQLTHADLRKYKDYYREILDISSPLILKYIDEFKINKSTLVAELLYLQKNNIIEINNSEIKINYSSDLDNVLRL